MDYIIDGIYIGNWNDSANYQQLKDSNIQTVINVTQHKLQHPLVYKSLNIEYHWFNVYDEPDNNIARYFKQAVEILNCNRMAKQC